MKPRQDLLSVDRSARGGRGNYNSGVSNRGRSRRGSINSRYEGLDQSEKSQMNSTEYEARKVHFLEQAKKEKDWLLDTKLYFCVNMGSMEVSESIDTEPMIIVIKEAVGFKFPAE